MNLGDLMEAFRDEARDSADPPLWSDAALTRYANDAQRQAARRGRLLIDSSTVNDGASPTPNPICQYAIAANDKFLTLDPRIIFVKRLTLASTTQRIPRAAARDLDDYRPGWESETGQILCYAPDYQAHQLRWYQIPDTADTASLTVVRLPLNDLKGLSDTPEIAAHFHERLVDWMLWRGYSRDDTQTSDPRKAANALARFELDFPQLTARDEAYMQSEYDFGGLDGVA